jgi:phospholipid/cholesterol/gamma-HCH transport system substrate-binding protein
MTKAQKIRIGLFVVVTGALLAVVLFVLGGVRFWEGRDRYTVEIAGSVIGLQTGAQVHLNGIRVGAVEDIAISSHDLGKVDVTIALKEGTPIRSNTKAMLQMSGITGLKVIDLRDGTLDAPALAPGSAIAQGDTVLDQLEKQAKTLVDGAGQLVARSNKVIDNLAIVTDPKQFEAMSTIMEQAKLASANLAAATGGLKTMIAENRVALRQTIASAGETSKSAQAMLDGQISQMLANANDLVTQMKGLVADNSGSLKAAVFDLRQASRSFKELSREVRQRPSRLFFGDNARERKLP